VDVAKLEEVDSAVVMDDDEEDVEVLLGVVVLLGNVEGEILEVVVLRSVVLVDVELLVLSDEEEVDEESVEELVVAATEQIVIKGNLLQCRICEAEVASTKTQIVHLLVVVVVGGGRELVVVVVVVVAGGGRELVVVVVVVVAGGRELVVVLVSIEVAGARELVNEVVSVVVVVVAMATQAGEGAARSTLQLGDGDVVVRTWRGQLSRRYTVRLRKKRGNNSAGAGRRALEHRVYG
jgi:hypothetical protein